MGRVTIILFIRHSILPPLNLRVHTPALILMLPVQILVREGTLPVSVLLVLLVQRQLVYQRIVGVLI